MMKRRAQQGIAAFVVTVIVMAALCGFVLVDLSTERYMPPDYIPLFQIMEIGPQSMRLALLGREQTFAFAELEAAKAKVWKYRGLLPSSTLLAGSAAVQGYLAVLDSIANNRPPQEPW